MESIKGFIKAIRPALTITLILMAICGLIYPLFMTGVSQLIFKSQANGNLIYIDGVAVGSKFVGQDFTEDYFMKCRPSAVHYNTYTINENGKEIYLDGSEFTGLASGSYNYGPSNPALQERIENNIENFLLLNPEIKREDIPADLMTASGSGLDPHISLASAKIQLPAISKASGLSIKVLEEIVENNTTGKLLGLFGEETVNVLGVNIDIKENMENK